MVKFSIYSVNVKNWALPKRSFMTIWKEIFCCYDNIIFLDFDGVLVTDDYRNRKDQFGFTFIPECVSYLKTIIEKTNARLVITSSWVNNLSFLKIKRMWKFRGLPGKVVDIIPNNSYDRGCKIDRWLLRHTTARYIIIDDLDYKQFARHHTDRLITTDTRKGIDLKDAESAIRLFT